MFFSYKKIIATTTLVVCSAISVLSASSIQPAELTVEVFNPGKKSLFPVTSSLITGPTEAVLIDAQFQRDDALTVLKMIQDSGKELKTIYISHGDPDFYFGLDVITEAYPEAKIIAAPETLAHINRTVSKKIAYWGPILGENAPQKTIIPKVLDSDTLTIDGEALKIVGLDGIDPKHTFVWIPSLRTVTGGVVVVDNLHVWMADNQTSASRDKWLHTLDNILELKPEKIIPGHFLGNSSMDESAVTFTRSYIQAFEDAAIRTDSADELTEAMKKSYPDFTNLGSLELSAKVLSGEMQWP